MHKVLWTVGLSNGEVLFEEKGDYQTITGELSPWRRLQEYIADNNLRITSLALYTRDGRRFVLPSKGTHPRFHALSIAPKPVQYLFERHVAFEKEVLRSDTSNIGPLKTSDHHAVARAIYEDGTELQMWVSEESLTVWSFVTRPSDTI